MGIFGEGSSLVTLNTHLAESRQAALEWAAYNPVTSGIVLRTIDVTFDVAEAGTFVAAAYQSYVTGNVISAEHLMEHSVQAVAIEAMKQSVERFKEDVQVARDNLPADTTTGITIGGALIEQQIAEMEQLKLEQEAEIQTKKDSFAKELEDQAAKHDQVAKAYFEKHPEQTNEEQEARQAELDQVKEINLADTIERQQAELETVEQRQASDRQQQVADQMIEAQLPAPPPQKSDHDLQR